MSAFAEGLSQDQKIMAWDAAKKEKDRLVELERAMRDELVATCFPDAKNGTNNLALGAGWKLKAVTGFENKLDANVFALIQTRLKPETVEACVKFTPSLVATGYKALGEEEKKILNEAITTKPKAVTLELVPPKES